MEHTRLILLISAMIYSSAHLQMFLKVIKGIKGIKVTTGMHLVF